MKQYFSLVTFSHTIFALPFALLGFTLGVVDSFKSVDWIDLLYVVLCMVFARSAAMAFNRLVDADIDLKNERTAVRDIPSGRISKKQATTFIIINSLAFIICAGLLNFKCLLLSPVALAVILGYSYTKRFSWLCHLVLGVGLALAPIGAYIAVTAGFNPKPILLGAAVLCWVAGFDIVYALQDQKFDKEEGLYSIPSHFGTTNSLWISRTLHILCFCLLTAFTLLLLQEYPALSWTPFLALAFFAVALLYQHFIIGKGDLRLIDRAFFTTNGLASMVYSAIIIGSIVFNSL